MTRYLVAVVMLALFAAFIGSAFAQPGMMGRGVRSGQTQTAESPQGKEGKPSQQPSQMPMTPEFAARMMNACIGAMEGMAQMGHMMGGMGGQGGTAPKPSEKRQ